MRKFFQILLTSTLLSLNPILAAPGPTDLTLTGRVMDLNGHGLAEAKIEITSSFHSLSLSAGPDGRFQTRAQAPGLLRVLARTEGFAPLILSALPVVEPTELPTVRMASKRDLEIRVEDLKGKPIAGAEVRVEAAPLEEEKTSWRPAPQTGTTGENGTVRIATVSGRPLRLKIATAKFPVQEVEVGSEGGPRIEVRLREGFRQVLEARDRSGQPEPGTTVAVRGMELGKTDDDGRFSIVLAPNDDTPVRLLAQDGHWSSGTLRLTGPSPKPLAITLEAPAIIEGRVLGKETRKPLARALVWSPGDPAVSALTDPQGRFRLTVPFSPEVRLNALAAGYLGIYGKIASNSGTRILLRRGRNAVDSGAKLEGRVIDSQGEPLQGVSIQTLTASGPDGETLTGPGGEFILDGLSPGAPVTLRASHKGYAPRTLPGIIAPSPGPLTIVLRPSLRIAGRVVDESGEPVAGAAILVSEESPGTALTAGTQSDVQGRFALEDLKPGKVRLAAFSTGFLRTVLDALTLQPGEAVEDLEVVLRRGATIEGRVLAPDGSPAPGAKVTLEVKDRGSAFGMAGQPEAVTDEEGQYRLDGVPEGAHTVTARKDGSLPTRKDIEARAGANRLDLRLEGGSEVSGWIVSAEGPVHRANVFLMPVEARPGTGSFTSTSEPDGAFRFEAVADGRYRLSVEKQGYATVSPPEDVRIAGAPLTGLEVRLDRGGAVAGRLLGLDSRDAPQAQVWATMPNRPGQTGTVGPDGRYRIEGLTSGEWLVIARVPVKGREARGVVALAPGQTEAALDLELGAGLVLSGTVSSSGEPVLNAVVSLRSERGGVADAATGADGRFRIEGLPAGTYLMSVLHPRSGLRTDQPLSLEGDQEVRVDLAARRPE
jgi:Carboxypeptidase regulatory-like domain